MKGFNGFMEDSIKQAKIEFGEDFNTDSTGNFYKLAAIFNLTFAYLEGRIIANKVARNIFTATGTALDDLLTNSLVFRIEGSKSKGTCVVKGNGTIDIAVGSIQVKGSNGLLYSNAEYGRITNGSVTLKFECDTIGAEGNIPKTNIASTVKAPNGVVDVQNDTPFIDGLDRESDFDYLERYLLSVEDKAWNLPAIKSAILKLDGVKSCGGIRNNTNTDGVIPKKSIRIVVDGGDDQAIANELYLQVHTANTVGSVEKQVEMTTGQFETIRFDRPKATSIDYQYTIISPDKAKIIELIKEYLNEVGVGEIVSAEQFRKKKLDDVIQINTTVLDLGFKKSDSGAYSSYLQLSFDEKGQAGTGVEV